MARMSAIILQQQAVACTLVARYNQESVISSRYNLPLELKWTGLGQRSSLIPHSLGKVPDFISFLAF